VLREQVTGMVSVYVNHGHICLIAAQRRKKSRFYSQVRLGQAALCFECVSSGKELSHARQATAVLVMQWLFMLHCGTDHPYNATPLLVVKTL
jgi:hypothetical protein